MTAGFFFLIPLGLFYLFICFSFSLSSTALSACSLTALIPPSLCVKRKLQAFNIWCVWIAHKQVSVKHDQVILWVLESALPQHHHHIVIPLFPTSKQHKISLFSNTRSLSMNKLAAIWSLSVCMISALINYSLCFSDLTVDGWWNIRLNIHIFRFQIGVWLIRLRPGERVERWCRWVGNIIGRWTGHSLPYFLLSKVLVIHLGSFPMIACYTVLCKSLKQLLIFYIFPRSQTF